MYDVKQRKCHQSNGEMDKNNSYKTPLKFKERD